jgi:tRNA wybutosine-synthesizing protein 3
MKNRLHKSMDLFGKEKADFLKKLDKSRKGSVDTRVIKLIKLINSKDSYYTTSSCAGRILLIQPAPKKDDAKFIFAAHRKVYAREISKALYTKTKGIVRLQQQNVIIHIACRDLDSASRILNSARAAGFRQSGITSLKKIVVEIKNPEGISMIAKKGSKVLLNESCLKIACAEMNSRLEENYERINKLHSSLMKVL